MNALEIAKQLLKSIKENPEQGEQLVKSMQARTTVNFQKSYLDEDYTEVFAKSKCAKCGKSERLCKCMSKTGYSENPHKGVKGVHTPVLKPDSGTSAMAVTDNPARKKALANQVIGEQKGMKKPNLPKTEKNDPVADATAKPAKTGFARIAAQARKAPGALQAPKPPLALKAEKNPDEKADAKLGEQVEGLVEGHMSAHKIAERKEGHKISFSKDMLKEEYGFGKK